MEVIDLLANSSLLSVKKVVFFQFIKSRLSHLDHLLWFAMRAPIRSSVLLLCFSSVSSWSWSCSLIKRCLSTALISLQLSGDLSENQQLASAYDNYASHYDKLDDSLISKRLGIDNLRDDLASYVHGDVLEVAMGTGIQLQHYDWSRIGSFAGIDLSEGMLSIAREKIEKIHVPVPATLQQMNVEQMTWRDQQVQSPPPVLVLSVQHLCHE